MCCQTGCDAWTPRELESLGCRDPDMCNIHTTGRSQSPLKHHSPCVAGVKSTQASPATPWPCSSQSCRRARCSRRCWRFVVLVNDGVAAARARLHFCDLLCKAGLCEQQCKAQACFLSEQTSNKHSSKRNRDNVEKWVLSDLKMLNTVNRLTCSTYSNVTLFWLAFTYKQQVGVEMPVCHTHSVTSYIWNCT